MSKREPSLVSIVTPTYNSAKYLEDLLLSVEAQDYPSIEHIVIDDGSIDDGATRAVLSAHPRARWWSRENRGQWATVNEGLRAARGQYVTVINADDLYASTSAIGVMAKYLDDHGECEVAHGVTLFVDGAGAPLPVQPYQRFPHWMLQYNLGFLLHCSMLVRRERLLGDGLFFDESLRYVSDGDWEARMYRAGFRFGRVEGVMAAYRQHELQTTAVANRDAAANASRSSEGAAVKAKYARSRLTMHLVSGYVNFQQRRVKASAAWRRGGLTGLWRECWHWLARKQARRSAIGRPGAQ